MSEVPEKKDDFTVEENEYFSTLLADDEVQKKYERFNKWKTLKTPTPLPDSETLPKVPATPLTPPATKDWTLRELQELAASKPSRSILKSLLEVADASEAAEALKSAGADALPEAEKSPLPKTPDPLKSLAKAGQKLKKFI